jgi:hypothetical protein
MPSHPSHFLGAIMAFIKMDHHQFLAVGETQSHSEV